MEFIDSHAHLYLDNFTEDIDEVLQRARDKSIARILLPNIDCSTIEAVHKLEKESNEYCLAMMGLHPCSVKANFAEELATINAQFEKRDYIAVGEIGLDYYWDKSTTDWQKEAFHEQVRWAHDRDLPIVIHSRDSIDDILDLLETWSYPGLEGVFHCFTGDKTQVARILDLGFMMGLGGVITFKNSNLDNIIHQIPIEHVILETDAPYLTPHPHRGKRNESSYIPLIAKKVAATTGLTLDEVARQTTANARRLFRI